MNGDRNEADRILGEDWMEPKHVLVMKALEAHPERERILWLHGRRTPWSTPLVARPPGRGERPRSLGRGLAPPVAARPARRAATDQGRDVALEGGSARPAR
jgi:hypothetical protein